MKKKRYKLWCCVLENVEKWYAYSVRKEKKMMREKENEVVGVAKMGNDSW